MLLLLHAIIPCFTAWVLPYLLHFLAHPSLCTSLNSLMSLHLFHWFLQTHVLTSPTPFYSWRLSPTFL